MIPDTWRSLLQNPQAVEFVYDRLTAAFRWEDEHQEDKLCRTMGGILRRAFETFGPMSTRVFENELFGHLGSYQHPSIHRATSNLSPEQDFQRFAEEFDTEIYEALSHCPSAALVPRKKADDDHLPEPRAAQPPAPKPVSFVDIPPPIVGPIERIVTQVQRQVRDTELVTRLKQTYGYRCQFCKTSIPMGRGRGWYCEAHHIRPLGSPHNGADSQDNILIVCPNHHTLLGYGAIQIDLSELAILVHSVSALNVQYHNEELHNGT